MRRNFTFGIARAESTLLILLDLQQWLSAGIGAPRQSAAGAEWPAA